MDLTLPYEPFGLFFRIRKRPLAKMLLFQTVFLLTIHFVNVSLLKELGREKRNKGEDEILQAVYAE